MMFNVHEAWVWDLGVAFFHLDGRLLNQSVFIFQDKISVNFRGDRAKIVRLLILEIETAELKGQSDAQILPVMSKAELF